MHWKKLLKRWLNRDTDFLPRICYAQDGEDLILDRLLDYQDQGFYIDVGAHHPVRFSNTYLFYRRGWRGINIDAMPNSMKEFQRLRKRDINLECGVAGYAGTLRYYRFNEPALNTFDCSEMQLKKKPPYHVLDEIEIAVKRLDVLLDEYLPANTKIDFLSVDVEGKDEEVLRSNNWNRYRPRYVLAETLRVDMQRLVSCPVAMFMSSVGYKIVSKAYNTSFFERIDK